MQLIGEPKRNGIGNGVGTKTPDGGKYPALVRTTLILGSCALGWSTAIAAVHYLW